METRNDTGSAQGDTVDCAGTTEFNRGSTDSAQGGTAVMRPGASATGREPGGNDTDSGQDGAAVETWNEHNREAGASAPGNKGKRRRTKKWSGNSRCGSKKRRKPEGPK